MLHESWVIQLRFALADGIWYSQSQVARQVVMTKEQVNTFQLQALRRLSSSTSFMELLYRYVHVAPFPLPLRSWLTKEVAI